MGVAATLGTGWYAREYILKQELVNADVRVNASKKGEVTAKAARDQVEARDASLRAELAEAQKHVAYLTEGNGLLVEWAFEEGGDDLPVLVGREGRLELLDQQYERLIGEALHLSSNDEWVQQWQVERALLALLRDKPSEARKLVGDEVSRLGGRGLTSLLLKESNEKKLAREDLALARNLVKRVEGGQERWLQSALDLVEVRGLEMEGKNDRALRLLTEVGGRIAQLPSVEPGAVSLWRTRLQREAADVAEASGREGLATEFRQEMVKELRAEMGVEGLGDERRQQLREDFVIAAEGLAEYEFSRGEVNTARALAEESLSLFKATTRPRVNVALAVHHAVLGGCLRERGKVAEAQAELEEGLALIAKPLEEVNAERWRRYREGMLKWQLSGVIGQAGDVEKELVLGQESLTEMRELLAEKGTRPSEIQVHRVLGYLSGDLAQNFELQKNHEMRNELLDEAIESWKFLRAANPKEAEYVAGLAWCEQLKEK